jgi:putative transposase
MCLIHGVVFNHDAVRDWDTKLITALAESQRRRGKVARSWYVDETCTKVQGVLALSRPRRRALRRAGDVMFSEHRDMAAAKAFFESAKMITEVPLARGGHHGYPRTIRKTLGAGVRHPSSQYPNNRLEQDHRRVKGGYGPVGGSECTRSAGECCRTYDQLRNILLSRFHAHQRASAACGRFHFLRHTATVLHVLETA